jgi:hypothetical protein
MKIHTLDKGWWPKADIMLHAVFQIIVDFVEKDKPVWMMPDPIPENKLAWKEIRSLYRWWTKTRPARKSPLFDESLKWPPTLHVVKPGGDRRPITEKDRKKYAAFDSALETQWGLEQKWEQEDRRNLVRAIRIREHLIT